MAKIVRMPPIPKPGRRVAPAAGYAAALALVTAAALAGFIVEHLEPTSSIALVFVLPVLAAALSFGWGPALLAALAGALAFDLFFTEPKGSLTIASPGDVWALSLLLVVAAIASTVAAESRRRRLAAQLAADRAEALNGLARLVIEGAPRRRILQAAAEALFRICGAPAVVLLERADRLEVAAMAGGAELSAFDGEAARWTLAHRRATRAQAFPFDAAEFDLWPIGRRFGQGLALGVRNPSGEGRLRDERAPHVQLVGAYVAAALAQAPAAVGSAGS